mgnify:FL=1
MKTKTFTEKVLDIVRKIPKGRTMTYKDVAKMAGSPRASRAVGSIMKANYLPDVPCHRVVMSSGNPGEYNRGGVNAKIELLKSEVAIGL